MQPASLVRPSRAVFNQILLGGQGQLHALLPLLATLDAENFNLCRPGDIPDAGELRAAAQGAAAQIGPESEIVHLRFGPTRYSAC